MKRSSKIALMIIADIVIFAVISMIIIINSCNLFGCHSLEGEDSGMLPRPPAQTETPLPSTAEQPIQSTEPISPVDPVDPVVSTDPVDPVDPIDPVDPVDPIEPSTPEPTGLLGGRFPNKFSYGQPIITDDRYASESIDITVTHHEQDGIIYEIADIYIQDIECYKSHTVTSSSEKAMTDEMAQQVGAIVAINGDMSVNSAKHGWIVRNGYQFHSSELKNDICILYWDGTMETYDYKLDTIDRDAILASHGGVYQVWYFGPELLNKDGSAKTSFNSTLNPPNPRTAIGYWEPGHYCFISVKGRRGDNEDSLGMSMEQLSNLCSSLGLKSAYNLDGGGSVALYFNGRVFGHNDRGTSDILYIAEKQQ